MNEARAVSRRSIIIVWIGIITFMAIGSFEDFQISSAIVNQQNPYGLLFAAYGSVPIYLLGAMTGFLMLTRRNPDKKAVSILQAIFGCIFFAGFTLYMGYDATNYMTGLPVVAAIVIGIAISCAAAAFVRWALKDAPYEDIVRLCWAFVIMGLAGTLIINIIKTPWSRPRMRFLISDENHGVQFHPWYRPGCPEKAEYIAEGVKADQFKSFPSGHTQSAGCLLGLYYLAGVSPRLRAHQNRFFWIAIAWTFLTALSRIIMGAHFLTDVTMGFTIEYILFLIVGRTIMRRMSYQS